MTDTGATAGGSLALIGAPSGASAAAPQQLSLSAVNYLYLHQGVTAANTLHLAGGTVLVSGRGILEVNQGELFRDGGTDATSLALAQNSTGTLTSPNIELAGGTTLVLDEGLDGGDQITSAGQITLDGPVTIEVPNADDVVTIGGVLSGSGGLTKTGPGTLELSGANTYTGPTAVQAGTLLLTGSTAAGSPVTVTNATLLSNSTIGGSLTIGDGGRLVVGTEGNQVATLHTGSLTFLSGSRLFLDIAATQRDQWYVTGTITIGSGAGVTVTGLNGYTPPTGQRTTLIWNDGADAVTGGFRDTTLQTDAGVPFLGGLSYQGGDGNDVNLETTFDYGDAPTADQSGFALSYPTLQADDGACHFVQGPRLGDTVTVDGDGQPTAAADGDSSDDGVQFLSQLVASASAATKAAVLVNLQNAVTAKLDAWFDFNRDGDWDDSGEHALQSVTLLAGDNTLTFAVTQGASAGTTFARFRVTSQGIDSPRGAAPDGEVEDYAITLVGEHQDVNLDLPAPPAGQTTHTISISYVGDQVMVQQGSTTLLEHPNTGSVTTVVITEPVAVQEIGTPQNDNLQYLGDGRFQLNNGTIFEFTNLVSFTFAGGAGNDTLTIGYATDNAILGGGLSFDGGDGNDTLLVDYTHGDPIPAAGLMFHGGDGGHDTLGVRGAGGETVVYQPDAATNGNGQITIDGDRTITFTGLEPVDFDNVGTFILDLLHGDDSVIVTNGSNSAVTAGGELVGSVPAMVFSGSSGLVGFESAHVFRTTNVIVNTTLHGDGNDTIRIDSAYDAHGNTNLSIITGSGSDSVTFSGPLSLSGNLMLNTGGTVTQAAGAGVTASGLQLLGAGSFTLTDSANDVNTVAGNVTGVVRFRDADDVTSGTVAGDVDAGVTITTTGLTSSADVRLQTGTTLAISAAVATGSSDFTVQAGGAVSQTAAISGSGLELLGAGPFTLANPLNDFVTLAAHTSGAIHYADASDLLIGTVTGDGTAGIATGGAAVTINALTGTITVSPPVETSPGSGGAVLVTGSVVLNNTLTAGAGAITLHGNTAPTSVLSVNRPITSSGTVTLTAPQNVNFSAAGDVTAGGTLTVMADSDATNTGAVSMANGTVLDAGSAAIVVTAAQDVTLGELDTTSVASNAIRVSSTLGALMDVNGDTVNLADAGGGAVLSAATGIGAGDALETDLITLDALNSTSGDIAINEVAAGTDLTVNRAWNQTAAAGSISVTTENGTITVQTNGVVNSGSNATITLDANDTGPVYTGSSVVLNAAVSSTNGLITITADQDVTGSTAGDINSGGGAITITADADVTNPDPLRRLGGDNDGTIQLAGNITAGGGTVTFSLSDCDGWLGATPGSADGNVERTEAAATAVVKIGTGILRLNGATNRYIGTTTVNNGTLLVNGEILGAGGTVSVTPVPAGSTPVLGGNSYGTLYSGVSNGAIARNVSLAVGGILDPGDCNDGYSAFAPSCTSQPGKLTVNGDVALVLGATLRVQLNGVKPGMATAPPPIGGDGGYDQLAVNGTVTLGGATLETSLGVGFSIPVGAAFRVIDNLLDPVNNQFHGLAEGGFFHAGTDTLNISYHSGSNSNDVTLTHPGRYDFDAYLPDTDPYYYESVGPMYPGNTAQAYSASTGVGWSTTSPNVLPQVTGRGASEGDSLGRNTYPVGTSPSGTPVRLLRDLHFT
ncbi:MAG: autotransporter-associated beta strand repeat-containing protein, partial [Planctomycetota bacterium]|nr:autotransporter-associated beta strand repeat-containing protein [Planctomycetota bacterium]